MMIIEGGWHVDILHEAQEGECHVTYLHWPISHLIVRNSTARVALKMPRAALLKLGLRMAWIAVRGK